MLKWSGMHLKKKKPKSESIDNRYSVPVPGALKESLDDLKHNHQIDVNAMARDFFKHLVNQTRKNEEKSAS